MRKMQGKQLVTRRNSGMAGGSAGHRARPTPVSQASIPQTTISDIAVHSVERP